MISSANLNSTQIIKYPIITDKAINLIEQNKYSFLIDRRSDKLSIKKAIEYLSKFDSDDEVLGPTALGAIGDAFADINQPKDALEYYEKAANKRDNEFTTPIFLFNLSFLFENWIGYMISHFVVIVNG